MHMLAAWPRVDRKEYPHVLQQLDGLTSSVLQQLD